jgi:hypothetical protein
MPLGTMAAHLRPPSGLGATVEGKLQRQPVADAILPFVQDDSTKLIAPDTELFRAGPEQDSP